MKRVFRTFGLAKAAEPSQPAGPDPVTLPPDPVPTPPEVEAAATPAASEAALPQPAASIDSPSLMPPTQACEEGAAQLGAFALPPTGRDTAVVTVDCSYRILSADAACRAMFGWETTELVGQQLEVLLHEGLDQEVAKFLQQHRAGDQNRGTCSLRVLARRKDGTEFPASVTTLTWSSDTTLTPRSESASSCWTAVFCSLVSARDPLPAPPSAPVQQPAAVESVHHRNESAGPFTAPVGEGQSARSDAARRLDERNRLESELHGQLNAARTAAERAEAALQEETARNRALEERLRLFGHSLRAEQLERTKRFDEEMFGLRHERDDLNARLAAEHEAAVESQRRAEELQHELTENAAFLERANTELTTQAAERERSESELRQRLATAEGLTRQLERACTETDERCKRFEEELVGLRQQRDELTSRMMTEQQAAAESRQRALELEHRLRENAAELERVRAQLQNASRDGGFEMELIGLQQVRDALNAKLTTEQWQANEARRRSEDLEQQLRGNSAELERIKADRDKLTEEQARLQAELQAQLEAARIAAGQLDAALQEKAATCCQLETELAGLQQARQELSDRLTTEQQATTVSKQRTDDLENRLRERTAELARAKAEQDKHAQEQARLELEWRAQLEAAKAAAEQAEAARKEEAARNRAFEEQLRHFGDKLKQEGIKRTRAFEEQLGNFRQERHEMYEKFAAEQQVGAKLRRRVKDLEKQVRDSISGQAGVQAELEKATDAHSRVEVTLRTELAAARAAAQRAEAASREQNAQGARLREELASLRQAQNELDAQRTEQRQTTEETDKRIQDLENRLRESVADLGRAKAALENQTVERERLESAHRNTAGSSEELTKELLRLRETEAAQGAELAELERRLRESVATIARATADLEKERGERRRVEQRSATLTAQLQELHGNLQQHLESDRTAQERTAHLEQQLHEAEEAVARANADLQKEAAARQLAEDQLQTTAELISHLRNCVSSFEQAKGGFRRMQDELESRLQTSNKALSESQARLQQETSERQRLEEALAASRRSLQEQSQSSAIELAKLQSEAQAHQFERQRLEGEAIHSRYASVDSARVGNAMVNSFRRRIRPPLDVLLQSTRRLLEAGMEAEPKKLAESVLENALLLQSSLQESGPVSAGTSRTGGIDAIQTDVSPAAPAVQP